MKADKLLEAYRQTAIRYGRAIEKGNPRAVNRAHDKLVKLSHPFRHGGPDMQRLFMGLLEDEDVSVRAWAATHALEFASEEAVSVLRKLESEAPWPINLDAEMVLREWAAGTLRLP